MQLLTRLMSDNFGKRDTMPLTWLGRMPVYASTMLVALLVVGMVACVLLTSAQGMGAILPFRFDPQAFWKQACLWQVFTFQLINFPSFFYLFGLCFVYWFGVGIETYLGRRVFLRLLLLLCLVPALTASAWWLGGHHITLSSQLDLSIGLFIAYATLYPNAELWNWIPMKWVAFACIVLQSLMFFPLHEWEQLTVFLSACAAAHLYTRYEQGHWTMPRLRWPSRKPAFHVVPRENAPRRSMPRAETLEDEIDSEVDELLEKIARSGLASLTSKERTQLEKAREALLKKERK